LGDAGQKLTADHRHEGFMDLLKKGLLRLTLEWRDLINEVVDPFSVLEKDKSEKGHKENVQEDKEDVLGESSGLGRGEVPEILRGSEEPGGQAVFDRLGSGKVGLDILEPRKSPDLLDQLFQFSITDITIGPMREFDDLGGHINDDKNKGRNDNEKYRNGHNESDGIVPLRERFAKFFVKRVKGERKDRRPKNSCEERREDVKDLVYNESQDSDEEKRDELFAFHGLSPNACPSFKKKNLRR
jgi:hypothetical protein